MKILLVNDDGIYAKGILTLANKLKKKHEVTIVAPHKQMSGTSHSLTCNDYINFTELNICDGVNAYAISGTPADCVKFGIEKLMTDRPDVVISGINDGYNIGTDVIYSGTVNASVEAGLMGVKSIAVSQEWDTADFEFSANFVCDNLDKLISLLPYDNSAIVSINVPNSTKVAIKGLLACSVGELRYSDRYEEHGIRGFYLVGEPMQNIVLDENSDVENVKKGFVTLSPIKTDFNDYRLLQKLKEMKI